MTIESIQKEALQLPEDQRAKLAGELLTSLPALLVDEDGGVAEARRRSADLDQSPDEAISWDDIKRNLGR